MSNVGTQPGDPGNTISPLEGEAGIPSVSKARTASLSKKAVVAVVMLVLSLVVISALSINRLFSDHGKGADGQAKRSGEGPAVALSAPRRLDLGVAARPASATTPLETPAHVVPALEPLADRSIVEPIGVRRTGQGDATRTAPVAPEDAPAMLISGNAMGGRSDRREEQPAGTQASDESLEATKRSLEGYQRQLQGMLNSLNRPQLEGSGSPAASMLGSPAGALAAVGQPAAAVGTLFGGQLPSSVTPHAVARTLGDRSLTLPKGTVFTCALKGKLVSSTSGLVGCQVQRNVFSDDGRVLLIERGSHIDGEYRVASLRPGAVRIPVVWTRVRTPHGVTVDLDSPATGPLGESGVQGHVDNRWGERIGAAMLLSLIDDSVKLIIQNQANEGNAETIVLPSTTSNSSKLAGKVLDSTINIPPLIYSNQGGIVGVYVARDVDFSGVYELRPAGEEQQR